MEKRKDQEITRCYKEQQAMHIHGGQLATLGPSNLNGLNKAFKVQNILHEQVFGQHKGQGIEFILCF